MLAQFTQSYIVGAFEHDAVSVSVVLIAGDELEGMRTQDGVVPGGGGGCPVGAIQVTATLAFAPVPALLLARSA